MTFRDQIGAQVNPGDPVRVRVSIDGGEQMRMVPGFVYVGPAGREGFAVIEILGEQLEAPHGALLKAG